MKDTFRRSNEINHKIEMTLSRRKKLNRKSNSLNPSAVNGNWLGRLGPIERLRILVTSEEVFSVAPSVDSQ